MGSIIYSDVMLPPSPQGFSIEIRRKNYLTLLKKMAPIGAFLEVGPGNGEMLTIAKEAGFASIEVVDIDPGVIDRIQSRHPDVGAHLFGVDTHLGQALGTDKYACIVACHVFEHIPLDRRSAVLKDYHSMLVPGGLVLLEMPNPLCPLGGWANFLADPTHQLPMSSSGLSKLMLLSGFAHINVGAVRPVVSLSRLPGILRWIASIGLGFIGNLLGNTWDVRAPTYYAIARRA